MQRFNEELVRQEVMNQLVPDIYREALEDADFVPYGPGTLEDTSFDPMTLTFTVPLIPQVDLGDYRDYRLEISEVEVPEDELDEALEGVRERNAVLAPLERPAAEGDLLVGELVGRTIEGAEFLHEEEARIPLDPEEERLLSGLVDALIGLEEGEERTFTLVLPEDFQIEELAGQEVVFEAYVEHVYERILPDLDDDLARTVGNYDSFEELKASVRQRLEEKERAEIESDYAEHVLQDIIAQAEVSYPEVMLEEALDEFIENRKRQIERSEHMMFEDYLRIQGKTVDELREEMSPGMGASLARSLVLGEVVKQEALEVSEEALDVQIAESSEQYGERAEEVRAALRDREMREDVRNRMLANRALERLVAIARGELAEEDQADEVTDEEEAEEESA